MMGKTIAFLPAYAGLRRPGAPDAGIGIAGMSNRADTPNGEEKA
ncbi:hypothetical protein [Shewanella jiangmenensis]|nr:hypothetical protein [Shewanella jiangmenensis]